MNDKDGIILITILPNLIGKMRAGDYCLEIYIDIEWFEDLKLDEFIVLALGREWYGEGYSKT